MSNLLKIYNFKNILILLSPEENIFLKIFWNVLEVFILHIQLNFTGREEKSECER